MERFDSAVARRDQDERAAGLMIKAFAYGGNAGRARAVAQSMRGDLGFSAYDTDEMFDDAEHLSVLARITNKAAVAATAFPIESGPLRYLMGRVAKASVLDRLTRAVRIPFVRSTGVQVLGVAAAFVGEGQSLPVVRSEFSSLVHPPLAVGALVVATLESIKDTPDSEKLLRDELVRAAGEAIDAKFVSTDAATSIAPAGIAADATTIASTGSTAAAIATDLSAMVDVLAESSLAAPVWLLSAKAHSYLQLLGVTSDDGEQLAGFPVYSSATINGVMLLAGDRVALSVGDEVSLGASDEGDIQMVDNPGESATRISLFQTNSRALKILAFINFTLIAPSDSSGSKGIAVLNGASYG